MPDRRYHPLVELTRARLLEFAREPEALFWSFVFPVILAAGLGIAFSNRPQEPSRVAIQAETSALAAIDTIVLMPMSSDEAYKSLRSGRIDLIVEPEGDGYRYNYDPARPQAIIARQRVDEALQRDAGRTDSVITRDVTTSEPGGRYIDFLIPGLIGLNVMSSSLWGTGYSIVYARRNKLLRRLAATPMRRSHFLLSYILARLIFLALEVLALVLVGHFIFHVPVYGSVPGLALASLLGAWAFMGIALLVAARPDNTEVASGWMNVVMLPMNLLSGVFFSYERFPDVVQPFIRLLPLTALNDAIRAIMNEGAGILDIAPEMLVLGVWGGISFVLAVRFFRWL